MFKKIKRLFRRKHHDLPLEERQVFTRDEVIKLIAEVKTIAYNDGKRDGLAIARQQATRSLKEILKSQNS